MAFPTDIRAGDLDIGKVSTLARLQLTPTEATEYAKQLAQVLGHFERLKAVDVSGVEPTAHAFAVTNVWAEDVAQPGLPVELALKNAPAQREHMIAVPKVVE
jgi:aspartyl-tRNA(Asn)/glutamyl-tRNA(Gln) amidotransferase subunit C